MKRLAFAAALFAAPVLAQPPSAPDDAALTALAAEADAAWNAGDADRMAAAYAEDGNLRLGAGAAIVGREAIRAVFKSNFASRQGTMRHITRLDRTDLIRPDLAFTDAAVRVEQQQADGSWTLVRAFRNASIAVRGAQGWRLQTVRAFPVPSAD